MRIKKLLVPIDFSKNAQVAFDYGLNLANQLDANLFLLHVQEDSDLRIAVREGLLSDKSSDEELKAQVCELLESRFSMILAGMEDREIDVNHIVLRGDPKAIIPGYALEIGADLIVIGMHGHKVVEKISSAVLGSVAESVIRKSPCPVLVVRLEHASKPNHAV